MAKSKSDNPKIGSGPDRNPRSPSDRKPHVPQTPKSSSKRAADEGCRRQSLGTGSKRPKIGEMEKGFSGTLSKNSGIRKDPVFVKGESSNKAVKMEPKVEPDLKGTVIKREYLNKAVKMEPDLKGTVIKREYLNKAVKMEPKVEPDLKGTVIKREQHSNKVVKAEPKVEPDVNRIVIKKEAVKKEEIKEEEVDLEYKYPFLKRSFDLPEMADSSWIMSEPGKKLWMKCLGSLGNGKPEELNEKWKKLAMEETELNRKFNKQVSVGHFELYCKQMKLMAEQMKLVMSSECLQKWQGWC